MKEKIKEFSSKPVFKLLILSIVWIMILVPVLSSLGILSKAVRISWIFLIINTIFAALIGKYTKNNGLNFYTVLIFPVIFVIQVILKYGNYGFLFGAIYLLVSILSYILAIRK